VVEVGHALGVSSPGHGEGEQGGHWCAKEWKIVTSADGSALIRARSSADSVIATANTPWLKATTRSALVGSPRLSLIIREARSDGIVVGPVD
jgi:hypothetical protein